MLNKYFKLAISVCLFIFSIQQFFDGSVGSTGNGILLLILSSIILFLFFKNEFLLLAFFQLRKQNMNSAKKWLERVKNPKSALTKKQQVDSLVKLGVSKALIRSLRLESDRIDKIIELNTK